MADMNAMKPVMVTDDTFDQVLADAGDKPVMVDFYADWCGPCQMVAPVIDKLAGDYAQTAVITKLNVDENPETARKFGVMSIPTVMVFKNGSLAKNPAGQDIKQIGAFNESGYKKMIDEAM